ncbi:DUF1643 domain-containing protein [Candidatus Woesearchaeota archaeon]|nr:DUF1643 domain-containing protein [Candidatus Woesearchaeota archaeon]
MIYKISKDNKYRYVIGEESQNPLFVLGINPSTATDVDFDTTIKKVKKFSLFNKFNGWIVLNIYPQRAKKPDKLDDSLNETQHIENIKEITEIISRYKHPTIWAAWGNTILKRYYLKKCLVEIKNSISMSKPNWISLGDKTQKNHPRHPSRLPYKSKKEEFDIDNYIKNTLKIM